MGGEVGEWDVWKGNMEVGIFSICILPHFFFSAVNHTFFCMMTMFYLSGIWKKGFKKGREDSVGFKRSFRRRRGIRRKGRTGGKMRYH